MTLTPEGEVVDHTIAKSVIRTTERMTYEDCNLLLDGQRRGQAPALQERYRHILPMLEDMAALSKVQAGPPPPPGARGGGKPPPGGGGPGPSGPCCCTGPPWQRGGGAAGAGGAPWSWTPRRAM